MPRTSGEERPPIEGYVAFQLLISLSNFKCLFQYLLFCTCGTTKFKLNVSLNVFFSAPFQACHADSEKAFKLLLFLKFLNSLSFHCKK